MVQRGPCWKTPGKMATNCESSSYRWLPKGNDVVLFQQEYLHVYVVPNDEKTSPGVERGSERRYK